MNSLSLVVSEEAENRDLLEKLILILSKHISDDEIGIYKSIKEENILNNEKISLGMAIRIINNFIKAKNIDLEVSTTKIRNLRDLKRFVLKNKSLLEIPSINIGILSNYENDINVSEEEYFIRELLNLFLKDEDIEVNEVKELYSKELGDTRGRVSKKIIGKIIDEKDITEEISSKLNEIGIILGKNIQVSEYKKLVKFITENNVDLEKVKEIYEKYEELFLKALKGSPEYIELFFSDDFQYVLDKVEDKNIFFYKTLQVDKVQAFIDYDKEEFIDHLNWKNNNTNINVVRGYINGELKDNISVKDVIKDQKKLLKGKESLKIFDDNIFSKENKEFYLLLIKHFLKESEDNDFLRYIKFLKNIKEDYLKKLIENIDNGNMPDFDDFYEKFEEDKKIKDKYYNKLKPILIGYRNSYYTKLNNQKNS